MSSPGPIHSGSVQAAAKAMSAAAGVPTRTSVRSRDAAGRSRTLPAKASVDSARGRCGAPAAGARRWRRRPQPARTASPSRRGWRVRPTPPPAAGSPRATAEAAMTGSSVEVAQGRGPPPR